MGNTAPLKESSTAVDTASTMAPYIINPLRNTAGSISGESPFAGEVSVTDVDETLWSWEEVTKYRLCKLRGEEKCIRPEE